MGGRCAEKIKYGDTNCNDPNGKELSTGAHDDLEKRNTTGSIVMKNNY